MKKWVVFVELTDNCEDPAFLLDENGVRKLIDYQLEGELPTSISYKIRSIAGPFDAKAAGAR